MKEMSSHERILSVYKNQMPDKTPLSIYKRYLPSGNLERELRNSGMGIIEYIPVVTMLPPPWHILPGFLSEISGCNLNITHIIENGKYLERREYSTPVGNVFQEIVRDIGGVGSEHIRKNYIQEPNDYKTIQWIVENSNPCRNEEMIKERIKDLGDDGIVIGRLDRAPYQKLLIELAGPERFLLDMYDEPEIIEELLQVMDSKMDAIFEMAMESSVEVLWQPDNITADMTPPSSFEKYCLPYYQKHSKQAKSAEKPYLIHMDGKIKPLTTLLKKAGFDAIESVSIPEMGGDYTIEDAQKAFPEMVILPNFPSNWCLLSEENIIKNLVSFFEKLNPKRPIMLQVSEDIPATEWKRVLPIVTEFMKNQ